MPYELYYWDGVQGRGEFVRLALEEAGVPYIDVARGSEQDGYGTAAMLRLLSSKTAPHPPYAPPFLKDGELTVSHVANILLYLGPKLGLAPGDERLRYAAHGLQLTITDAVAEIHDTHHPIDSSLYYEDQKEPAKARAAAFLSQRLPKYLGYFGTGAAAEPRRQCLERRHCPEPCRSLAVPADRRPALRLSPRHDALRHALPGARRGA